MKPHTYSIPFDEVINYYYAQQEYYDNISSEAEELKGNDMQTNNDRKKLTLYHLESKTNVKLIQESIKMD